MRLARARTTDGVVAGEHDGGAVMANGTSYPLDAPDVELLAPCEPSAFFCVGRNFAATIDQMGYDKPDRPDFFIKPPVSRHPPDRPIEYPEFTDELTYAGELAAVIDEPCTNLTPEEVTDVVRGYTVMNDLDALDQDGRTARKAFDGSAPLGPWIETDVDPSEIEMETVINDEVRQEATTEQMLFDPHEVVSFLSERFTFAPGDVIAFGSPANPGLIEPGDEIAITYEGVGTLTNTVE
ncbi:fumarylacetoacetate hydrolase family protein [Halococcus salsus]|uniref:fumarylacetoacetate hydrolase family protein n=1 Tax=Halococcus salsus TaxID=2162894 RepID=UPI00135869A2|nr:fumarylacetoacetate hydrolase family protein [Halococcus salsus]